MKTTKAIIMIFLSVATFTACKKDNATPKPEEPFEITDHFVAGTLSQKTGSKYTSVFFIQFLEDGKALFINSSANNLVGNYSLTDTELVFEVSGGNARIARFTLDENKNVTAAYYKALETEYEATGALLSVTESNQLAGKVFGGEEFKMGQESNRIGVIYDFNLRTSTYGSGTDSNTLDNTANNYILIGGSGFKHVNGSNIELGFISNETLTVFRVSGLYFYGVYDQR